MTAKHDQAPKQAAGLPSADGMRRLWATQTRLAVGSPRSPKGRAMAVSAGMSGGPTMTPGKGPVNTAVRLPNTGPSSRVRSDHPPVPTEPIAGPIANALVSAQ